MKKLILTLSLAAVVASSTFGQGYFVFAAGSSSVWDDWSGVPSSTPPRRDNTNFVAFLIGSGAPLINNYQTTTATNQTGINTTTAWTDLLTDPNYRLATNVAGAALIEAQTTTLGAFSYLGGANVIVTNTSSAGGTIQIIAIAWSVLAGSNPFIAAQNGAPIGWSTVFTYTYAAGPSPGPAGTPGNDVGLFQPFGVQTTIPEPTTLALLGLGSASLLIFRRRKS